MTYIYSIIRKDIPLADQIVQTAHSAYHAGSRFGLDPRIINNIPNMVLLEVKDREELIDLAEKLYAKKIRHYSFFEPDDDLGLTSITTDPLDGEERKVFSNMRLWRA